MASEAFLPRVVLGLIAAFLPACSAYRPQPFTHSSFLERAQSEAQGMVRVSVAALGPAESRQHFGVNLAAKNIQPVWLRIDNGSAVPFFLLLSSVDPAYFSAREAAYRVHTTFGGSNNARKDAYFESQAIDATIPPGATRTGFVFTNLDHRIKYVNIQLFGPREMVAFRFLIEVPDIETDYDRVDFDALYRPDQIIDIAGEHELHAALEQLPAYTTRRDGTGHGDPINFVLIGDGEDVGSTLVATDWQVTEALSPSSAWRTFRSFLFGGRYRHAPMSSLYVFGRSQDAGFQKARDSIHQRNHLRLWLTPLRYRGREVYIGAISRDIGVYFTPRAWSLTTHAIDPDLDEARDALAEDLILSQAIRQFGYVAGIGAASSRNPHRNLMNAPYWTDGRRTVFIFGDDPTSLDELELLNWETPGAGGGRLQWSVEPTTEPDLGW